MAKGGQSPVNVTHHLKGIDFPANKKALIDHATRNKADKDVMDILQRMPEREYASMADVMKGVGDVE
jgi:Protein of unknown function (DUF2795)